VKTSACYLSLLLLLSLPTLNFAQENAPAPSATGKPLLTNADFQTASPEGDWAADWEREKDSPVTWEKENDRHFVRLTAPQPNLVVTLTRTIDLPPEVKGIDISIRFRAANFKFGDNGKGGLSFTKDMHFNYQFLNTEGERVAKSGGGFVLDSHAKDWTDVTRRALVPEGAVKLKLIAILNRVASATLDIAQIQATTVPDSDVEAIKKAATDKAQKALDDDAEIPKILALPAKTAALKVSGNRLVTADGTEVWLRGVNVPSLEWSPKGELVLRSIKVAIDDWKANVIRLPVHDEFWFGRGKPPQSTSNDPDAYRKLVDDAIQLAAARGAYIILDLHRFHAADDKAVDFWKDAAARYKDNPAVLFDLYNEPTGITWDIWRNGGDVPVKAKGNQPATSFHSPGMQGLLDAVRSTGAKNIIVAGGIGYAYDLSGVLNGYALEDKTGNGIMYATHFYNWHRDWEKHFLHLADKYPLLVGEFGADINKMSFIPAKNQEDPYTWVPDALGLVEKYHLNWTAFSLHPKASPVLIKNWDYDPTPFWGVFVKDALAGKKFELQKMR
jgi:endoglucanase